jgi:hypothetical protein
MRSYRAEAGESAGSARAVERERIDEGAKEPLAITQSDFQEE